MKATIKLTGIMLALIAYGIIATAVCFAGPSQENGTGVGTRTTNSNGTSGGNRIEAPMGAGGDPSQTVYIAGYYYDSGNNSKSVACWWKNGVRQTLDLTGAGYNSRANAIAVDGDSVYAAGYYMEEMGAGEIACYWKDGARLPLEEVILRTGGENPLEFPAASFASAITIHNGSVYVSGYTWGDRNSNLEFVARWWKDGKLQRLELTESYGSYVADSITVTGSGVYVGGYYISPSGQRYARLWKDGVWQRSLEGANANSEVREIAVTGSGVYAAGYHYIGNLEAACYWLDGKRHTLYRDEFGMSKAEAIAVSGSDVYIAGWCLEIPQYRQYTPCYWKNGERRVIDLGVAADFAFTNSIAVSGNSVHIVGYYSINNKTSAYYWKDGALQPLDLRGMSDTNGSYACSIVVVRNNEQ